MMFFGEPDKNVIGRQYLFKVFGELKDGHPRFHYAYAEPTEEKSSR